MSVTTHLTSVPDDLKSLSQWVLWRWEKPRGSLTKVPYSIGGRRASSTNRETWSTFEEALAGYERGRFDGIGCVVTKEDPFAGIDLDKCIGPETEELSADALEIVEEFDSYTEITPSEEGVRVWVRAQKNGGRCSKLGLEIYDSGRYFTVTGRVVSGSRTSIEKRQSELDSLIAAQFPEQSSEPSGTEKRPYNGASGEPLVLMEFLAASGVVVHGEAADSKAWRVFRVVCPWSHEHTGGDTSGTRVGQYQDGALFFHCEHAHCSGRRWSEFRAQVDPRVSVKLKRCRARRIWKRPS